MKEEYVTYEQSQALKRLGFAEPCDTFYNSHLKLCRYSDSDVINRNTNGHHTPSCSAPRLDQAQKWLREEKGIMIEPFASIPDKMWAYRLYHTKGEKFGMTLVISNKSIVVYEFNSYELALSAGIDKALDLLTDKKRMENE